MIKNVLIASQKNMLIEGLCLRLKQEPDIYVVDWAEDQVQFDAMYDCHRPDAILICSQFLGINTPRFLRETINHNQNANVLVISNIIERHFIVEVMESGAKGFLSSLHAGFDEMVPAARSVANGNTYVCQKVSEVLLGGLFNINQPIKNEILSDREKQVLRLISDGQSSKEIARVLYISPSTVSVHRRNLMRKIGAHKTAELTRYAIRSQLVSV